jgi:hypothetical protein
MRWRMERDFMGSFTKVGKTMAGLRYRLNPRVTGKYRESKRPPQNSDQHISP